LACGRLVVGARTIIATIICLIRYRKAPGHNECNYQTC
jgi:hypothetical protein